MGRPGDDLDFDVLTGHGGRRAAMEWIEVELGLGHLVAVTLARLDRLDEVNAALGLDAGDAMMRGVAARLRGLTPARTRTARLGDGVFLLASADRTRPEVSETGRRILVRMRERLHIGDISPPASVSIGIAHSDPDSTAQLLLPDAHLALRAAREGGGDRMAVFEDTYRTVALTRLRMEQSLAWALRRDQVDVHYQPVFDLGTHRAVGAEALSRWTDPRLGAIPPVAFIPVAEGSDLMERLTRRVIERAAAATARWSTRDPGWVTWVNACPRLLAGGALGSVLAHHRAMHGLEPTALGLEITEQDLSDPRGTVPRIAHLAGSGVPIAIDDFGTGHSSIARLRDLPAATVKIDRSFIRAGAEPAGATLLAAIVGLGHAAGKLVVAEGIETADELRAVRRARFDLASGNYLAPATPAEGLEAGREHGSRVLDRT